jgi:hypothetical protein
MGDGTIGLIGSSSNLNQSLHMFLFHKRKFIGNPRGNIECGSAQPSLFIIILDHWESLEFCLILTVASTFLGALKLVMDNNAFKSKFLCSNPKNLILNSDSLGIGMALISWNYQ